MPTTMAEPLVGRTALVSGAGRGIGAAIARALDAAGARVALVARTERELRAVAAGLAHDPVVVAADLGTAAGPDAAARHGRGERRGRGAGQPGRAARRGGQRGRRDQPAG